jgi:hypothetical protein
MVMVVMAAVVTCGGGGSHRRRRRHFSNQIGDCDPTPTPKFFSNSNRTEPETRDSSLVAAATRTHSIAEYFRGGSLGRSFGSAKIAQRDDASGRRRKRQ